MMPLRLPGVRGVSRECCGRGERTLKRENDLGRDAILPLVLRIALPSMLAQFVSVFYSIVDRMYIGNIPEMGDVALAGVVILVVHQNGSFHYAGSLIYAMALYTFYVTIMAVVNLVRYRKYQSPAMSAAKAINLAAALVSMLSPSTPANSSKNDRNQIMKTHR